MVRPLARTSLEPRGPVAGTIADLWWLMLGLGVAVFVVVGVLLAVGLLRPGRRAGSDEGLLRPGRPGGWDERRQGGRWVVGGGVVLPVLVLFVVLAATVAAMRAIPTSASRGALTVEVVGHQWWFEVRYPEEDVTARGEMHIPVGRRIVLRLTSADVIHSFWVPELAGKRDMLPDSTNTLVLQADTPGRYQSRCAEFCGLHHADMRLLVVAEPAVRFAAWLTAQR